MTQFECKCSLYY